MTLDVSSSEIVDDDLILVLKSNPNLKHLIIGSNTELITYKKNYQRISDLCEHLLRLDDVVRTVVEFNKELRTWSSWKTLSLTADGIRHFGSCPNIVELDLGWCLVNKDPGNCLKFISEGCPNLSRYALIF